MRSLRARLFLLLVAATVAVWSAAAVWTFFKTRADVQRVLDRRLVEAAGMVASLVENSAGALQRPTRSTTAAAAALPRYSRQLSCQIWTLDWRLVGRSGSAPVAPLARGNPGFSQRTIGGEPWRVYTLVEPKLGLRILIGDNLRVRRKLVGDVLTGLLLPAVFGLLALSILIWSAIARGLRPLRRVARELVQRDPGDTAPLRVAARDAELQPLVEALNGLFGRLEHFRASERHFIASAAHELQTPLAGLKAHAQIALFAPDAATRTRSLHNIKTSVDRTSRLVQQLLDLSREEAHPEPSSTWTSVSRALEAVADEFSDLLRRREVRLEVAPLVRGAEIHIDDASLLLALRNLIKNALEHSPTGASVRVSLERDSGTAAMVISDEGPGIPSAELERIRERFVRGSRAKGAGSGLGLSIVELVLERSGATLELRNRAGGGLDASMRFPAAAIRGGTGNAE